MEKKRSRAHADASATGSGFDEAYGSYEAAPPRTEGFREHAEHAPEAGSKGGPLELKSVGFGDGSRIPDRYTGFGDDVSPALAWGQIPPATESLALLCDDPDAKSGSFVHWLAWNIDPKARDLPEGASNRGSLRGAVEGKNGFGQQGYGGPKPPPGKPHHYVFHLYALDTHLDLPSGAGRRDFETALAGHVLGEGTLIGTYGR